MIDMSWVAGATKIKTGSIKSLNLGTGDVSGMGVINQGIKNNIGGNAIVVTGNYNQVNSSNSHIVGDGNIVNLDKVTIFGDNMSPTQSNTVYINQQVILGPAGSLPISGTPETMAYFNTAGNLSSIFVINTSKESLAIGSSTVASGLNSFASGNSSQATGNNSVAEGAGSVASGVASHAEGSGSVASGGASHAGGFNSAASNWGEWARGTTVGLLPGDYQCGTLLYTGDSIPPGTTTELFLDGASIQATIPTGMYFCKLKIVGSSTAFVAGGLSGFNDFEFFVRSNAGALQFLDMTGTTQTTFTLTAAFNTGLAFVNTITIFHAGSNLRIEVNNTGLHVGNWIGKLDYIKTITT